MRNILVALSLLLVGFAPTAKAEESKVQTSIGVRSGVYMSQNSINGQKFTSSHLSYDVDWLRHRKMLTWGLGVRRREADSSVGKLSFTGVDLLIGYYSNKDKRNKLGFHGVFGLGPGSMSGVGNGYARGGIATHVEMRCGLDLVVMRASSAEAGRKPSAMVLTMDLGLDGLSHRIRPASAPKGSEKMSSTTGKVLAMGIRYDF